MQTARYRIYLDGNAIKQSALDAIDTVTVQQEMDQAWQATLVLLVCTSERGLWDGEDDPLTKPFKRVRIEVAVESSSTWVPLIDGAVVGYDSALSPEPSQSSIAVRVSDDTIKLWRRDESTRWTGDTDSDIARNIFTQSNAVSDTRIDKTEAGTSDRPAAMMQRRTLLDTLHELASRHPLFHAWVAPGEQAGQSLGMFKKEDTRTSGLPALVLLGAKRNLDSFTGNGDLQRPADVTSHSLDLSDLSTSSATVRYSDEEIVGSDDPVVSSSQVAALTVPPGVAYGVDPQQLAQRFAAQYGEAFDARGVVRSRCYAGVLLPYKMVEVKGVNGRLSGNYVIKSVTHTLTRSEYTQEFSLLRRGQSGGSDAANPNSPSENVI